MPITDIEKTINWKSENAICQDKMLSSIIQSFKNGFHIETKLMNMIKLKNNKVEKTFTQHNGLIRQLELRVKTLQYDIYP